MLKYSWNQIESMIKEKIILIRSPEGNKIYEEYIENLKKTNINMSNFLMETLFTTNKPYVLALNKFPYNVESDIYHYVFWINPNKSFDNNNTDKIIKQILSNDVLFFENPEYNKTVKSIVHYHVFSKIPPGSITDEIFKKDF